MKELKEYFSGRGQVKDYVFNQIRRTKFAFVYEVRGKDTIHHEVFKRVENEMYDNVSYPTDKAFGVWAWTCISLERANEKFKELNELGEAKENAQ